MTIAEQLRDARERAGLSQSQAATVCGVPVRTLQGWEVGRGTRSVGPRDALSALEIEAQKLAQKTG